MLTGTKGLHAEPDVDLFVQIITCLDLFDPSSEVLVPDAANDPRWFLTPSPLA